MSISGVTGDGVPIEEDGYRLSIAGTGRFAGSTVGANKLARWTTLFHL
jgi:hypothetical protein